MGFSYEDKKVIADAYLKEKAGVTWDELDDVNSLHEVNTRADIIVLCDIRLLKSGFPEENM